MSTFVEKVVEFNAAFDRVTFRWFSEWNGEVEEYTYKCTPTAFANIMRALRVINENIAWAGDNLVAGYFRWGWDVEDGTPIRYSGSTTLEAVEEGLPGIYGLETAWIGWLR